MKHTKRPWTAVGEFVRDVDGRAISYCQSASGKRSIEEVHANAILEAAAPDMLEALKGLLYVVTRWAGTDTPPADVRSAAQASKAAIAQATP